jgi:hypothetical protein
VQSRLFVKNNITVFIVLITPLIPLEQPIRYVPQNNKAKAPPAIHLKGQWLKSGGIRYNREDYEWLSGAYS